jgi:hypothetical protein
MKIESLGLRPAACVWAVLLFASCGRGPMGATADDDGGQVGDAGQAPTDASTDSAIALQITCSSFVPALAPYDVVFVDSAITGPAGSRVVSHRFRATGSCGFDVVISLPNLQFAADDQPYQMSVWWSQSMNTGAVDLLAIVLRRSGSWDALLAVAAPGSVDLLNFLVSPLAVTLDGPVCTDPAQAGNTRPIGWLPTGARRTPPRFRASSAPATF